MKQASDCYYKLVTKKVTTSSDDIQKRLNKVEVYIQSC